MAHDDVLSEIKRLKDERNAVILAHNYQPPDVQDIADFLGDSLGLSQKAAETDADVIVFCGVDFMAETAKILSPEKTVLLPEPSAACPMAAMVTADDVRRMKAENPGVPVVSYVNTSAAVKAESDVCCTSSNLEKVVGSLDSKKIIFIPDKHMANYVRKISGKDVVSWEGYCPSHVKILPEHIKRLKREHPDAEVLVHPECRLDVIELADVVTSTGGMVRHVKSSPASGFIIGTEAGMVYRLRKESPGKVFYPASESAICPNMKKNSVQKVLLSLRRMEHKVDVPEGIRIAAKRAIDRMLELA